MEMNVYDSVSFLQNITRDCTAESSIKAAVQVGQERAPYNCKIIEH